MKKILLYTLTVLLTSCNSDTNIENYYYYNDDLDKSAPFGTFVYKSTQPFVFNKILITTNVTGFRQNSKFVVARQELDTSLLRKYIYSEIEAFVRLRGYNGERNSLSFYNYILPDTFLLRFENNDSNINYLTRTVLESPKIQKLTKNDINYWIIQKSNDSTIGPLTKSEFDGVRIKLDVPDKLQLD